MTDDVLTKLRNAFPSPIKEETTTMNETTHTNGAASASDPDLFASQDGTPNANETPKSHRVLPGRAPPKAIVPTGLVIDLVNAIGNALPDRQEAAYAIGLALLAGEHALMIGPPGTAKTMLANTFAEALGMRFWSHLMTRYSTPEEILGPQKLTALQHDRFERATEGYLPTAEIVLLDEIFKSSSAILNALLGVLNERVLIEGATRTALPLISCLAASNELPDADDGLSAIEDRFMVRVQVGYVGTGAPFKAMLAARAPSGLPTVDLRAERLSAIQVTVTSDTIDTLDKVREALAAEKIVASDRRWRSCLNLLRACAYLDGRQDTEQEDIARVLQYVVGRPEQINAVHNVCARIVNPAAAKAQDRIKAARALLAEVPDARNVSNDPAEVLAAIKRVSPQIKSIVAELDAMPTSKTVERAKRDMSAVIQSLKDSAAEASRRMSGDL